MKKIIEGKRNLLISIVLYCLSISIFLISQLSIVSGTFMSGSVFSYNYPLRVSSFANNTAKNSSGDILAIPPEQRDNNSGGSPYVP